jgi:hypothetical protein
MGPHPRQSLKKKNTCTDDDHVKETKRTKKIRSQLSFMSPLGHLASLCADNVSSVREPTGSMAELNVVRGSRGGHVGVEHEGADAVLELGWNVVDLVGGQGAGRGVGVGVVGGGVRDFVVGLCTEGCVSVAQLCLGQDHGGRCQQGDGC